ncbi:hypothetical protein DAI22_06g063000 [Oryza sativa Japonica Group]|nr:hypothetical protein DAI22_06g063000 [Oryza sativa Japonica Group]
MIHLLIHWKKKNAQNLPICRNPLPFFLRLRAREGTVGHCCPSPPYVGGVHRESWEATAAVCLHPGRPPPRSTRLPRASVDTILCMVLGSRCLLVPHAAMAFDPLVQTLTLHSVIMILT